MTPIRDECLIFWNDWKELQIECGWSAWQNGRGQLVHPDSPCGGVGPGYSYMPPGNAARNFMPAGPIIPDTDAPSQRGIIHADLQRMAADSTNRPQIKGIVAEGNVLSSHDVRNINDNVHLIPKGQYPIYVAYLTLIKLGGFIPWRFNNPGSLRKWKTEIANFNGFAIFSTMEEGVRAQKARYLQLGERTVRKAISILTPSTENDLARYLTDLQRQGIRLDEDVKSQIDALLVAVNKNEGGAGVGIQIARS